MWKIGNVNIKNQIVMAPMAGISNSAYRIIVKEMGCGLIYAEMVSDKAITFGSEKTIEMLYMTDAERPLTQQIFGSDVESFVKAAIYIYENMKPDIIDINMGCPVPKVALRAQAGSALLKNPDKVYEIVSSVVKSVPIPVTVKIRSGWDTFNINAVEIAQVCEKAGASAITIHGRTRSQGYSGKVDLDIIKQVKESISIPVIGNGDIKTCYDAKKMLDYTKCDAVMIGRGALGNPWIFKECKEFLESGIHPTQVSKLDKIKMIKKHVAYLLKQKPEKVVMLEMRSHVAWYLKGIPGSAEVKRKLNTVVTVAELYDLLGEFSKETKDNG
ncbi:MAG: tRNA dihydrouridine synthase DusB [Bacilli bacterium]|nr:tRNA dihydrouridine synthase DusB [Bacilli bacterium]MDD4282571.1 tRNA dihydrouridine synthase DusB [Bacilli bacterium]